MKMIKFAVIIAAFVVVIGCSSSASTPASSGVNTGGSSRTVKSGGGDELTNAIRETSDYLNKRIQKSSKVVFLNIKSDWPDLSEYILSGLTENAVNDDMFTVVDRQQLDLIRAEQNFQWSGEVSDASAQEIGQMLGAQTIVSGAITTIGSIYRIQMRAISVQTAAVQGQFSQNVDGKGNTVAALTKRVVPAGTAAAMTHTTTPAPATARTTPATSVTPAVPAVPVVPAAPATPAAPTPAQPAAPAIEGILVPGSNLAAKLTWLQKSAESHNTYIVEVNANENIAPSRLYYEGAINITVVLRGNGANRTVRLSTNGTMFEVRNQVTFILENNITLQGHNGNTGTMVYVNGGTFKMNAGTAISGNNRTDGNNGGGVYVGSGTFEMTGGTISNNTANSYGGGVCMNDSNGIFTMSGGTISGNTSKSRGGGVEGGTFTMTGGNIFGNTAKQGGGVSVGRSFTMRGGTITGNTAREAGGGVLADSTFKKTGGTITGYNSDQANGNVVRDESGDVLARKGHAVFVRADRRKETTAGPGVNLDRDTAPGWDQ